MAKTVLCTRCWANKSSMKINPLTNDSVKQNNPAAIIWNNSDSMVCKGGRVWMNFLGGCFLSCCSCMASSRACNAAIFNRLNAMMELSMWTLICQLLIWTISSLSGNSNVDSSVTMASGKTTSPSFSTGLLSVASSSKNATNDEMIEAVLNKLKLRLAGCRNIAKV